MLCAPAFLQGGRRLGGGAVQIHHGAAGVGAVSHLQLAVQELEIQRLVQTVNVHHHRRDIVGSNGAQIHRLIGIVGPHQQGGLVELGVRTGIAGIAALGKDIIVGVDGVVMVAPEHQNDRLVHLGEVLRQLAQHGVSVPDAGCKVFQCTDGAGFDAHGVSDYMDALIVRVIVLIIVGVVLHGDCVQEYRRIRRGLHGLILLDDLVGHRVIGDKAVGPVVLAHLVHMGHLFQADKGVQAQIGVRGIAAPILAPEAVNGRRLVALGQFEVVGQREHGLCHMLLIGLAAVGQEGSRVAGQSLELHIAGAAAKAGAVGPAIGAGLLQGMEVGGNIGVKLEAVLFQFGDIPVGLVHHIDDGGLFHSLVSGGGGPVGFRIEGGRGVFLRCFGVVQDLVDGFLRVAIGLGDLEVRQIRQKAGDDTVVAVVAVLHPGIRHNADSLGDGRLQEHAEDQGTGCSGAGKKAQNPGLPVQLLPPLIKEEGGNHQQHDQKNRYHHAGLDVDAGSRSHTGGLRNLRQIPGQERLAPQLQGVEVDCRRGTAQNGGNQRCQRRKAGQPVDDEPDQEQQRPGQQVGLKMRENVLGKGIRCQAAPGDPLGQDEDAQSRQQRKEEPQPVQMQRRFGFIAFLIHREKFLSLPEKWFVWVNGFPSTVLYYNPVFRKIKP